MGTKTIRSYKIKECKGQLTRHTRSNMQTVVHTHTRNWIIAEIKKLWEDKKSVNQLDDQIK